MRLAALLSSVRAVGHLYLRGTSIGDELAVDVVERLRSTDINLFDTQVSEATID